MKSPPCELSSCARAAELFITKGKSFAGIPLTMTWHVGPFPGQGGSSTVSGTVQKQTQSRSSPSTLSASSSRSQSPPSAATPASGQAPYPASLKLASANPDDDYGSPGLGREGGGGNGDRDFEGQGWSPEDNDQRKGGVSVMENKRRVKLSCPSLLRWKETYRRS